MVYHVRVARVEEYGSFIPTKRILRHTLVIAKIAEKVQTAHHQVPIWQHLKAVSIWNGFPFGMA